MRGAGKPRLVVSQRHNVFSVRSEYKQRCFSQLVGLTLLRFNARPWVGRLRRGTTQRPGAPHSRIKHSLKLTKSLPTCREQIFVSDLCDYRAGAAIAGGVSVCFPSFEHEVTMESGAAARRAGAALQPGGLVNTVIWQVELEGRARTHAAMAPRILGLLIRQLCFVAVTRPKAI